ncbi:ribonuclease E activity regulator RraA [Frondihabitans cladoniiphilus]|uniref:4-hydroxy-4-methyl-2-oxoglutarate aldolase n=1 Tax=Frondihabitans cladoniiphilus TaxID=715785 RepID=A0ABP8VJL0_9MICO
MTTDDWSTNDLADAEGFDVASCDLQLRQLGGRRAFTGTIVTIETFEDNTLLREALNEPGAGRVVVVDGSGSLHVALMGDDMAGLAARNGWEGIVINGCMRDVAVLATIDIGLKALGSNPRKSKKERVGARDVPVTFGGVTFRPGDTLYSDEDGIVVLPA